MSKDHSDEENDSIVKEIQIANTIEDAPIEINLEIVNHSKKICSPNEIVIDVYDLSATTFIDSYIIDAVEQQSFPKTTCKIKEATMHTLLAGNYCAIIWVYDGKDLIAESKTYFDVLNIEEVTKNGMDELIAEKSMSSDQNLRVMVNSQVPKGKSLRIMGIFKNPKKKLTTAQFVIRVHFKTNEIATLESEFKEVITDKTESFVVEYKPTNAGEYVIHALVKYDDEETSMQTVRFYSVESQRDSEKKTIKLHVDPFVRVGESVRVSAELLNQRRVKGATILVAEFYKKESIDKILQSSPKDLSVGNTESYTLEYVPTSAGRYHVRGRIFYGNEKTAYRSKIFFALENAKKTGSILKVQTDALIKQGKEMHIKGTFSNPEKFQISPYLAVEVYYDNELIKTLASGVKIAPSGESIPFDVIFKPSKSGMYHLRCYVVYENQKSIARNVIFYCLEGR